MAELVFRLCNIRADDEIKGRRSHTEQIKKFLSERTNMEGLNFFFTQSQTLWKKKHERE